MWRHSSCDEHFNVFRDFDGLFGRSFADVYPGGKVRLLTTGAPARRRTVPAVSHWHPAVESFVKDDTLFVRAEIPGVDPADVNVTVTGNLLTITGEKKSSREIDEKNVHLREVAQGVFERSFRLPKGIRPDSMKAEFKNGVLEVTVPMPESVSPKTIEIEVSGEQKKIEAS